MGCHLVLFDVDGTLVKGRSSERGFMEYLFRRGRYGPRQVLASLLFLLVYLPRFRRDIFKKNKAYLTALETAEVGALAENYVREELMRRLHGPSLERLRRHVAGGDDVVLLTGAPEFIAEPLAAQLGVRSAVSSRCPRKDGRFAWGPPTEHPFGAEKLEFAKHLAEARGVDLQKAIAYADSRDDLTLMRAVGTPVAVRPDARLRREATRRGWEIIP
ncbi:MAG: HAD-IB family phosphatase [Gammaproteobacteria bacterium]|nr:HAD-IB family phosphatase [Gammaproteobacteria bacterium]